MQEATLLKQPTVAGDLNGLFPQAVGNGFDDLNAWEYHPNMGQASVDPVRFPYTTPGFVAQPSTDACHGPGSSKPSTAHPVSETTTGDVLAQPTHRSGISFMPASAKSSFESTVSAGKPSQKRKAKPRERVKIKNEEEDDDGVEEEEDEEECEPGVPPTKRNKFLERNRVAASKCRKKKKVWLHDLEGTKEELEIRHRGLRIEYESLMEEVTTIKNMLVSHAGCRNPPIDTWIRSEAYNFVKRSAERALTPNYCSSSSKSPPARLSMDRDSPASSELGRVANGRGMNYDHMSDIFFDG